MKHGKRLGSTEWIVDIGRPSEERTRGRDTSKIKESAVRIHGGQHFTQGNGGYCVWQYGQSRVSRVMEMGSDVGQLAHLQAKRLMS